MTPCYMGHVAQDKFAGFWGATVRCVGVCRCKVIWDGYGRVIGRRGEVRGPGTAYLEKDTRSCSYSQQWEELHNEGEFVT